MAGVDLNVYRFDYDLTFAALLMNADGTIYHTYGGRDFTDPMSHLSMASFTELLKSTAKEHADYTPRPFTRKRPRIPEDIGREAGHHGKVDCIHCHTIHDWMTVAAQRKKRWKYNDAFRYPDPIQIGLRLDRERQNRIVDVAKGSAAAMAGLRPGDTLLTANRFSVLTLADLQRALHEAPGIGRIKATYERDGRAHGLRIYLDRNWKVATPEVYAWRSSKWQLSPKPGFGGKPLTKAEREQLGLGKFAFRVGYLVTWGPNAHTGRNAVQAGIRKHDIVYSIGGKSDFKDMHHYHAWVRLKHKPGDTLEVLLIRGGKRIKVDLRLVE
jgi:membrane-associated protease RseP (regulator of RpoE activity)